MPLLKEQWGNNYITLNILQAFLRFGSLKFLLGNSKCSIILILQTLGLAVGIIPNFQLN